MLSYPDRFPAIHNANDCRWCWEDPHASNSFQLAKGLESAAGSIQHEVGHCHQSYSCLEAAHRLKETVRILSSDAPAYEQLNAIQRLHEGISSQNAESIHGGKEPEL